MPKSIDLSKHYVTNQYHLAHSVFIRKQVTISGFQKTAVYLHWAGKQNIFYNSLKQLLILKTGSHSFIIVRTVYTYFII